MNDSNCTSSKQEKIKEEIKNEKELILKPIRIVPHVEGNWPSFFYIRPDERICNKLIKL